MGREITPVEYQNRSNHHRLDVDSNPGPNGRKKFLLRGKFTVWNRNIPKKLRITRNRIRGFKVLQVDAVKQRNCDNSLTCNELQIKAVATPGQQTKNKTFTINGNCDLNDTDVVLITFSPTEVANGAHIDIKCSDCYEVGIPNVKKGNILQGGD